MTGWLGYRPRARIEILPDRAWKTFSSPVAALMSVLDDGWHLVDTSDGGFETVLAVRHDDGRWAVARLTTAQRLTNTAAISGKTWNQPRIYAQTTWADAAPHRRRQMLFDDDEDYNEWVEADDLFGLWELLLRAEGRDHCGEEPPIGDLRWDKWMAAGFWLTWQHPLGHRLREEQATGFLLSLSGTATGYYAARMWAHADEYVYATTGWDRCFLDVAAYMSKRDGGRWATLNKTSSVTDYVYTLLKSTFLPVFGDLSLSTQDELDRRKAEEEGRDWVPPQRDRLVSYASAEQVAAAVSEAMGVLDWENIDDNGLTLGKAPVAPGA